MRSYSSNHEVFEVDEWQCVAVSMTFSSENCVYPSDLSFDITPGLMLSVMCTSSAETKATGVFPSSMTNARAYSLVSRPSMRSPREL